MTAFYFSTDNNIPVVPNPFISNLNATSILLKWSPPFLWKGISIDYFNIFVTKESGLTEVHRVDTNFSDTVVNFNITADRFQGVQACSDIRFTISANSSDSEHAQLESYTVNGGYIPSMNN